MVSFSKDGGRGGKAFILLPFEGGVPRYQLPFLPGGKKERGIVEKKGEVLSQKKRKEEKRREEKSEAK